MRAESPNPAVPVADPATVLDRWTSTCRFARRVWNGARL